LIRPRGGRFSILCILFLEIAMTMRSWIRSLFARPATRTIRKAPRRTRLSLEALEDRWLPSTFTVLNTLDDGSAGSLRWAVAQANANAGDDTINFGDGSASGGTNFLDGTAHTIALTGTQLELTDTTRETTITGPVANLLSISGGGLSRVLQVDGLVTASISGVTITNGDAGNGYGGGLFNLGTTTLNNCTVSSNSAGYGGGVYGSAASTTTLTDCTVSGNSAVYAGGLESLGTLKLTRCAVSNNSVTQHGGGLENYLGTVTLTDCVVSGNTSTYGGGGLYLRGGQTTLTGCTVSANTATLGAGLLVKQDTNVPSQYPGNSHNYVGTTTLTNCTVSGNTATASYGGGVFNKDSNVTLQTCTISNNSAIDTPTLKSEGGGLFSWGGQTTLTGCTVSGNSSHFGGGLFAVQTTAQLVNCTISGNTATTGSGGGVLIDSSNVTLTNCTISGNSGFQGAGLWTTGTSSSAPVSTTLVNCTVSGNTATGGAAGGIGREPSSTGRLTLGNTIVAGNTAPGAGGWSDDVYGAVVSQGTNLIGKTDGSSGWAGSDLRGTVAAPINPLLAPLGNYGGPTQTMPLLPGSRAIDAGSNSLAAGITTDQRGLSRTVNTTVDIGAVESSGFTITVVSGGGQSAVVNTNFQGALVVLVTANNALEPVAGGLVTFTAPTSGASASLGATTATIGATGRASVTAKANKTVGSYTVTVTARGITNIAIFSLTNRKQGT
jgi:parallel beta-helix repeat protein